MLSLTTGMCSIQRLQIRPDRTIYMQSCEQCAARLYQSCTTHNVCNRHLDHPVICGRISMQFVCVPLHQGKLHFKQAKVQV